MRFLVRYILIALPLLFPTIANGQLLDDEPKAEGGEAAGAWMADSTALSVWVDPRILAMIPDPNLQGTVSGTLTLDADAGSYVADYASAVDVKFSANVLGIPIDLDSTFVVPRQQEGVYQIKDSNLILEFTPEDADEAVSDTLGFTAKDDSLFLIQVVPLPPQFAASMANFGLEAPLAVLGFAKVEDDSEPPPVEPPEPGPSADFNGDGKVDFSDFIAFAQNFGRSDGDDNYDAKFDLTGDDSVGFSDFIAFAQQFDQE